MTVGLQEQEITEPFSFWFLSIVYKKDFLLDGQTRQAKLIVILIPSNSNVLKYFQEAK